MLVKNILFASAYFISVPIAILLSLALNNVSPVWAGAGIALAGIYLYELKVSPGLFIGMLASQLYNYLDLSNVKNTLSSLLLCLIVSTGALLQACLGNWLIKQRILSNDPLIEDHKIIFFALTSISSCFLSASISTTSFALWQLISWSDYLLIWVTAWMSDGLGVLIFTPLILIRFAEPRSLWQQRIKSVAIPFCTILLFTFALFSYLIRSALFFESKVISTPFFFVNQFSWSLWLVLAASCFLIGFTAVTLLMLTGRTLKTELTIQTRTVELENARQQLTQQNLNLSLALKKARQATQAKNLFLANMSHELRTPLNAIMGFSQLLVRQTSLTEAQKEKLQIINQSGEHLLKLINEILDIAKIEAGQTALKFSDFTLTELFSELHNLFQERCEKKNITLSFNYQNSLPAFIHADKTKLRQILVNLIDNAIKATSHGTITVDIYYQELSDYLSKLYIEVTDTGVGIPKAYIKDIFKNFACFNSNEYYEEGSGLGLSITQHFVHLMGGEISVDSKIGQGSVFKFSLLLDKIEGNQVETEIDNREVIGLAKQQQYRVLVVDNLSSNRYLLTSLLSPLGFEVKEAANGRQAIEIWQNWQPHLILMDMRMPILNGYRAIKMIKKSPIYPVVVIAITASVFEEKKSQIIQAGCDDFISKPFSLTELLLMIKKHLGVEYIYQDSNLKELQSSCALNKASFHHLTDHLKKELYLAIQAVDINKIDLLIEKIAIQDQQLAQQIKDKIANFKYETLLEILKP
jgi:signal transduction histidine kinase/CheY-like chemotaxis protein